MTDQTTKEIEPRDFEHRLLDLIPHRLEFIRRATHQLLLSLGSGDCPQSIGVRESQVAFIRWLADNLYADFSDGPVVLVGDPHAGQWEAGIMSAVVLALVRGAKARIYTSGPLGLQLAGKIMRSLLPDVWPAAGDALATPLGAHGRLELVSIEQRAQWTECDVAVVDDYSSTTQSEVERALHTAPTRILCGDTPESSSEQWICAYRDAAHAMQRLFRFKWADHPAPAKQTIPEIFAAWSTHEGEAFWRPTGL
jgi:hypothetical protein